MANNSLDRVIRHVRSLVGAQSDQADGELLHAFAAGGDQAAFAALTKRHGPLVLAVCRRVLHQLQDAEDAFQATFIVLARQAGSLSKKGSLGGWLHRVAYRIALDARRADARRRKHERRSPTVSPTNPALQAAWREMQIYLDEEIQRLPEKYREPFILCCLESQSCAAIARRLGLKEATIWSRLAEARKRLQKRLSRRGVELTAVLGAAALAPDPIVAAALVTKVVSAATFPAGVISERVAFLVHGMTRCLMVQKAKMGVVVFLAVSAMVGVTGVGALKLSLAEDTNPRAAPSVEKQRKAPAKKAGTTDLYGDPLPAGAVARLGTVRFAYAGWINRLTFSPDGTRLASSGSDGVRIWESATGKPAGALPGTAYAVTFIDGGKRLVAAGDDLTVWDVNARKESKRVSLNGSWPHGSAFSPDGRIWAGVLKGGSFNLVAASDGSVIKPLEGHEDQISGRPKGGVVNPVQIWSVAFAPDGKTLASACPADRRVIIWDATTGKIRQMLPGHDRPSIVVFSPNGRMVAVGNDDGLIRLWDPRTGAKIQELRGLIGPISALAFAPDDLTLAAASRGFAANVKSDGRAAINVDGSPKATMHLWNLKTGAKRPMPRPDQGASVLAFSPDGGTLAAAGLGTWVHMIDVATGKEKHTHGGHNGGIFRAAVSPDGNTLASGGRDNLIHIWDLESGREKSRLEGHESHVSGVAFRPDGREIVSCSYDGTVRVWDWQRGSEIRRFAKIGGWHSGFALTPDRKTLLLASGQVWDIAKGEFNRMIPNFNGASHLSAVFSMDGKKVAVPGRDHARVVDFKTGKEICRFVGHEPSNDRALPGVYVNCVAFSPDGRRAASGGFEGLAFVWDAATGKALKRLQGHENPVLAIAFSPDGRMVATGSGSNRGGRLHAEQTVRLWKVTTGKERRRFVGHQAQVTWIAFADDGRTIISASEDGTILVWDVTGDWDTPAAKTQTAEGLWRTMGEADAHAAYGALCALAERGDTSVLAKEMRPVPTPDGAKIRGLIRDLDNKTFATRQNAERILAELEELVEPALRKPAAENTSLEARRRIEILLARLDTKAPSAKTLQALRGIEVLERIGTAHARGVLHKIAAGAPQAHVTRAAHEALARLGPVRAGQPR